MATSERVWAERVGGLVGRIGEERVECVTGVSVSKTCPMKIKKEKGCHQRSNENRHSKKQCGGSSITVEHRGHNSGQGNFFHFGFLN